jgi:hypothetical protein
VRAYIAGSTCRQELTNNLFIIYYLLFIYSSEEAISNVRTVKSFAAELLETEKYSAKVHVAYLLARKLGTTPPPRRGPP